MTYQKITLIGFLGHPPSLKENNGKQICEFNLAVTEKIKGNDETTWFTITTFDKTAENCKNYLNKGSQAYIEGSVKLETWKSKEGETKSKLKVVANVVKFLGSAKKQEEQKAEPSIRVDQLTGANFASESADDDSDIPF